MQRWSKEPRRISAVEGRAAASLVRVLMIVSCFIYNDETINARFCQFLPEHLFQFCFGVAGCSSHPKKAWLKSTPVIAHDLDQSARSKCGRGSDISSDACDVGAVFRKVLR